MGQTLTNGIYLPNEGERNCYSGLAANWNAVDTLKGNYSLHAINVDIHVTAAEKEAWDGKADASALTAHTGDTTIHVTAEDKQAWNGKADASALTAHTGNTTIHVTAEDKQAWNGKADASALTAHTGDTTIHVTSADKQAWNGHVADSVKHVTAEDKEAWDGHVADSVKHVTAEDKAKWDAVTSKAADSAVVHKSGDETITGNKTFSSINGVEPSSLSLPDLSNGIDISGYITVSRVSTNYYTPPANGWISISVISSARDSIQIESSGGFRSGVYSTTNPDNTNEYIASIIVPCVKNDTVTIYFRSSPNTSTIKYAKFFPCAGNL